MSIDSSLKIRNALIRHRNVLTRAERITILQEEERWDEKQSVLGLPKVEHRKSTAGKKSKGAPQAEAEAGAEKAAETAEVAPSES